MCVCMRWCKGGMMMLSGDCAQHGSKPINIQLVSADYCDISLWTRGWRFYFSPPPPPALQIIDQKSMCARSNVQQSRWFSRLPQATPFLKKKYIGFLWWVDFFAVVALLKMFYFSLIISYIYVDDSLAKQSIYIHIESCYFLNGKSYIYHLYVWCVCVYSEI